MSERPPASDEDIAAVRADSTLRALAEHDSLEPSRALDRAVLAGARAPAQAAGGIRVRRGLRSRLALRLGLSAGAVAAAVYAAIVLWTALRPIPPRGADQRVVEVLQAAPPRGTASRSPVRASRSQHEWRAPRAILIESIDSLVPVHTLQPSAAQESARRSSSSSARASASASGSPSR